MAYNILELELVLFQEVHETRAGNRTQASARNTKRDRPAELRNVDSFAMQVRPLNLAGLIVGFGNVVSRKRLFAADFALCHEYPLHLSRLFVENVPSHNRVVFFELELVRKISFILNRVVAVGALGTFQTNPLNIRFLLLCHAEPAFTSDPSGGEPLFRFSRTQRSV